MLSIIPGFAKSNTRTGDQNRPTGVVLSEIVLGNIPVQNGVVHLIRQPLTVIDKTVQQSIDEVSSIQYFKKAWSLEKTYVELDVSSRIWV